MEIILDNCGRRFNQDWIFRNFNGTFCEGETYALLGPNGSGKSTLLGVIIGNLTTSEGTVTYTPGSFKVENIYQHISFAAPYTELIEEFTLRETINFHFSFKPYQQGMNYEALIDLLQLKGAEDKALKYFSSGMKQRAKLAIAFCSGTNCLFLDEPTSNLDTQGIDWYLKLVEQFRGNKMFIVASNQSHEYDFCEKLINITDYKPLFKA